MQRIVEITPGDEGAHVGVVREHVVGHQLVVEQDQVRYLAEHCSEPIVVNGLWRVLSASYTPKDRASLRASQYCLTLVI